MQEDDDIFVNDIWSYYFHDPYDNNWNLTSYNKFSDISSVMTFWSVHNLLKDKIHDGMFFLMRESVFPAWDDDANRDGGCLSIKVLKQDMPLFWETISIKLLGETLLLPKYRDKWNSLNGISTSPKKTFCIIKIWVRDQILNDKNFFDLPPQFHGDILFRSNVENIQANLITKI